MLFAVVICNLVFASIANPLHKYPFVFLLDVGNEELEKTNTEQIRVSIPGGSLAVRYPAIGDGDLITHVRVSGIDFGTDLKANIINGGPGYKYIVLVFLGNTGVPYDAVLTIQTMSSDITSVIDDQSSIAHPNSGSSVISQTSDENDMNNSAEDIEDDGAEAVANNESSAELTQPSSDVYNYARVTENEEDIDNDYHPESYVGNTSEGEYEKVDQDNVGSENDEDNVRNQYRAEKLQVESNDYVYNGKYNKLLDSETIDQGVSLDEDARMYRQDSIHDARGHSAYSGEDPVELDQMFNDEEVHNDADKYKDSNNNNFDSEYDSAVAY